MKDRGQGPPAGPRPRRRGRHRRGRIVLVVLVALGIVGALWLGGGSQEAESERARVLLRRGSPTDLRAADALVSQAIADGPDAHCLHAAQDLLRAHLWVEYGLLPEVAITEDAEDDRSRCRDALVTDGLLAFAGGDLEAAAAAVSAAEGATASPSVAPHHAAWLRGKIALARADAGAEAGERAAAGRGLDLAITGDPELLAYRRLRAELRLAAGDHDGALAELRRARELSRTHLGVATDEALTLAMARRELSSVADLADQLLAIEAAAIGPYDRGRATLARAAVDILGGEAERGRARLDAAWTILPAWDRLARAFALELALESGDSMRALTWLAAADFPADEAGIVRAWALLIDGDPMASLSALAELPQAHPRVAYLQGLALVEQQRLAEAGPWIARAERLLPGRVELEVASARVAVQLGDKAAALRRLRGLAEEETFAPRAWTGLGEAYLAQGTDEESLRLAHRALTRAVEREPLAAEAMLRLSEVWQRWRRRDPESPKRALEWLERAAAAMPRLPRYRLALALHLVDVGEHRRAEGLLRELSEEPGIDERAALALAHLALERAQADDAPLAADFDAWLQSAGELGAEEATLLPLRARAALLRGKRGELVAMRRALAERSQALQDDVEIRALYARTLMALHEDEEALTVIRRGIYSDEDGDGRLFLALAELEARSRKRGQAALHARAAWNRLRDSDRPLVELLAAADLATRLFLRGEEHTQALAVARDLARRLPLQADAWRIKARTELGAGEAQDARRSIERALALAPQSPRVLAMAAQIHLRFGQKAKAREAYERALELAGDTVDAAHYREALRKL